MVDKKTKFVLSLEGWYFRGTLNDWRFGPSDFPTASRPHPAPAPYHGLINGRGMMLPGTSIEKIEHTNEGTFIFLSNGNYYELGNRWGE